jgi:hypothetical protein
MISRPSRRQAALLGLAGALSFTVLQAASGQNVTIRFHWSKGDTQQYRVTQESAVAMSGVPGMGEMNITTTLTQTHEYAVDDVTGDGTGTVRVKFASMKMGMNSPMGSMVWDSASPTAGGDQISQMMAQSLGPLVGQSITMVVTPTGEVKKIDGLTELMQKINSGMAASPMGGMPGMGNVMTEDSLRSMFEQNFSALPQRAVKVGETWTRDSQLKMPFGTVASAMTLALQGVSANVATITLKATNKVTVDTKALAGTPVPMNMTMGDGTSEGELAFDVKAGRIQKSTVRTVQPMSMNMTGPDGSAVSLEATTRSTTTVELIK